MTCDHIREWISFYIDDVLDDELNDQVINHIAACPDCKAFYDDLLSITSRMKNIEEVKVPEGLDERIIQTVFAERQTVEITPAARSKSWKKRYKRLSAMAAIFVVGIFAATMYNNSDKIIDSARYKEDKNAQNISQSLEDTGMQSDLAKEKAQAATENSATEEKAQAPVQSAPQQSPIAVEDTTQPEQPLKQSADYVSEPFSADVRMAEGGNDTGDKPPRRGNFKHSARIPSSLSELCDAEEIRIYMYCLENELKGTEFDVISCENLDEGKWRFTIDTGSETINYLGQDGKVWIETTEESSL